MEGEETHICDTKYPILLVHGIGFRGYKFASYWGRIPKLLHDEGASVFFSTQDAWGSLENNAEIIKNDIIEVLNITRAEKINIIAHSNGGIESRYVINVLGMEDKIASLTTFCTGHYGSKTMDKVLSFPKPLLKITGCLVNVISKLSGDKKPNFYRTCHQLSTDYCRGFNEKFENSNQILYRSYAAKMKSATSDLLLIIPYSVVSRIDGDCDGLVSVESAKWGKFMGIIEGKTRRGVSHSDAVDFRRRTPQSFDICMVYVDTVAELKELGL